MHVIFTFLIIFSSFSVSAQIDISNNREGKSFFHSKSYNNRINKVLKSIPGDILGQSFQESLNEFRVSQVCGFNLIELWKNKLQSFDPSFNDMKGALYYLRSQNALDDVSLRILIKDLNTLEASAMPIFTLNEVRHITSKHEEDIKSFMKDTSRPQCLLENYRGLIAKLKKTDKEFKVSSLNKITHKLFYVQEITPRQFMLLRKAYEVKLDQVNFGLKDYLLRREEIRRQFPNIPNEESDFVTKKAKKLKLTYREKIFHQYNFYQMVLMGDLIKRLKSRLEREEIFIQVNNSDGVMVEKFNLDPMERFRFSIRILRKEMSELSLNSFFAGRAPEYLDLITVAYELGIISSLELNTVYEMQEIWNPKKSFWDKASRWVVMGVSVGALVVPPVWGFVPTIALVVIEATRKKTKEFGTTDHSLF